ncbi:MAG: DNA-binding transcriptional MocR family regulator [Limisphaerales bacterium]
MTSSMNQLDHQALSSLRQELRKDYDLVAGNKIALDLSRGKPAADQLALSEGLENTIKGNYRAKDGTDVRNYGGLRGLPEARELGAELLDVPAETVIAGGNSSLNLMHLVTHTAMQVGLWGDERRWQKDASPALIAPVPGYDRHYVLSDALGLDLRTVNMTADGPNLEEVRRAVEDPSVKGIWCVPKYSNPTGCTYSEETVQALAELPKLAAAEDFVVLWDNAYAVHDLEFPMRTLASIQAAAISHGTEDHIVQFASTSKITFAGGGVAFLASSERVLATLESQLGFMTIGPDKVNQLRHVRFLQGRIAEHMQAHAALLKPKFDLVLATLEDELGELDIAHWTQPTGGYFVSLDLRPGLAREVINLAQQVGLTLTPAGATFPHNDDPEDKNVRIAPTFAELSDLNAAMQILTLCVKLATVEQTLEQTP